MAALPALAVPAPDPASRYRSVRARSVALAAPLSPEDAAAQSMPEASPAKWHLAHTSWFFDQFVLAAAPGGRPRRPQWAELFNSYYEAMGPRHARPERGLLTRPSLTEVIHYRDEVDQAVAALLATGIDARIGARIELGLQHEQQHQELLLTDIKHLLSRNPLQPAYRDDLDPPGMADAIELRFLDGPEGVVEIGHHGDGFAFDCETPRHRTWLRAHALANRPVNNAEYLAFIDDGGYRTPTLWLSDGWATLQREGWQAPLYWNLDDGSEFTLGGRRPLDPRAPVVHLSYFEADAFARWAGARLPTEAEWETAAADTPVSGNFAEADRLHPCAPGGGDGALQLFGDVWEWTASPYLGYPGFRPLAGALGEYNGKFMCGQFVLRGGSCASPSAHLRASYRNFFYPRDRWQFAGLRLARDR